MNNRKLRFNAIDAILIFTVAAVLFVLLYVFVFDKDNGEISDTPTKTIQYTVLIQNVDESNRGLVKEGQPVTDAILKKNIGTVKGVQVSEMIQTTFNNDTQKEVYTPVEGKINMKITIEAEAQETIREFSVDGSTIKVGKQYSLMFPDIYCVGYCIDLNDDLNN